MNIENYLRILETEYGFTINDEYMYFMDILTYDEISYQEKMEVNNDFKEKMVIGIYAQYRNDTLFAYSVSANSFFKYSYKDIFNYLLLSSFFRIKRKFRNIELLKLIYVNENEPLTVIRKTYWLRIIQRHWKRIFEERRWILDGRRSFYSLKYFELTGKYPIGLNYVPSIHGMLEIYNNRSK